MGVFSSGVRRFKALKRQPRFPFLWKRSYQTFFMAVTLPVLVVLNIGSAFVTGHMLHQVIDEEIVSKVQAYRNTLPGQIAEPMWSFRYDRIEMALGRFAMDPDVISITVRDDSGAEVASIKGPAPLEHVERHVDPIGYENGNVSRSVGTIEFAFSHRRSNDQILYRTVEMSTLRLMGAFLFVAAIIYLNRAKVVKPLSKLEKAMAESEADGTKHLVEWSSDDEVGRTIAAFNNMQRRLEEAERRRQETNACLDRLYNGTPALLHSVDRYGVLVHVSEYWLIETGYAREEVIGRPLDEFLTAESALAYHRRILPRFLETGITDDEPLRLVCRSGAIKDVLLAEIVDEAAPEGALSLSVMTDISEIKAVERELHRIAWIDPVSDLYNRRGFLDAVDDQIAALQERAEEALVFYLDLDRFKRVNDTFGHAAGDQLLRAIGTRLKATFGARALVGRLDGDEFAAFVPAAALDADICAVVERALDCIRAPVEIDSITIEPSGSIGVSRYPTDGRSAEDLLLAADIALYRAKNDGRDRAYTFDHGLAAEVAQRRARETDVRQGIAHGWFELFIQPIVRLADGRIVGGEALVRLRHPEKGLISPGEFIPAAEETGLIRPLGRLILSEAVRKIPALAAANGGSFYLSVNLSGSQVTDTLPEYLEQLLTENGVPASQLVLEIMETALLDDAEKVNRILSRVSALGIRFALDDFGTGFSSLNYVNRFPVDIIKIDRSFTRRLTEDSHEAARVRALVTTSVTLGRELGLGLVAEGIEHVAEFDRSVELGMEYGQGYLFSPPLPHDAFLQLARSNAGARSEEAPHARAMSV